MSDLYIGFVRKLKATAAAENMGFEQMGEVFNVHSNTVRNWFSFRTMMDGEAVLKAVRFMGGLKL